MRKRLLLVSGVVCSLAALPAAALGAPSIHASDVAQTLANAHALTVHGQKNSDGTCGGGFALPAVDPGQPAKVAVEVAQDPSTCTETFTVGNETAATRSLPLGLGPKGFVPQSGESWRSVTSGGPSAASSARVRARHHRAHAAGWSYENAYFYEGVYNPGTSPAERLSAVQNTIGFWHDGSCIGFNPAYGASDMNDDNWYRTYWDLVTSGNSPSCSDAYSASGAHYEGNDDYCLAGLNGGKPWNNYWRNSLHVNQYGSVIPYAGVSYNTGCSGSNVAAYDVKSWGTY